MFTEKRMKSKGILGTITALAVATALSLGVAGSAQAATASAATATSASAVAAETTVVQPADSTGQYEYNCVLTDGTSYSFSPSSNTTCNGSYIQQYLNGEMVQSVAITSSGQVAWASNECVIALTADTLVIVLTAGGVIGFVDALDITTQGNPPCTTSP